MIEDNILMANTTVIKLLTAIKDEDIIFVTYHNKVNYYKDTASNTNLLSITSKITMRLTIS